MRTIQQLAVAALLAVGMVAAAVAKDVQVKSYTRKDGTVVAGHTRHISEPDTQKVKAYTRKDGTVVQAYERKKSAKVSTK